MSIVSVTRTLNDPSGWTPVNFEQVSPNLPPPKNRTAWIPYLGAQKLFEAYTPNSSKDHDTYKNFEHFKALGNYAHGTGRQGFQITADLQDSNLMLDVGKTYDERILYYGIGNYGQPGWYNNALTKWYDPRPDGGFVPPPAKLESLKLRGLQAMMPKVKAELSSLVSLYEAKDILSIKGSIQGLLKLSKKLFTRFSGSATKPLAKAIVHQAGDSYLQWMFNIKPLISDIGGIYHAVAKYEKRINDLINRSGKQQVAHFMCPLHEELGTVQENWSSGYPIGAYPPGQCLSDGLWHPITSGIKYRRTTLTDSAVFRCQMQYNYTFTAFQREHAIILGFLDALGVNFNPKYIWNVVPWSFVIDWVVNISSWLDQFEIKNLEPKVNILQYCWSVKRSRIVQMEGYITNQSWYGEGLSHYAPQYMRFRDTYETAYRRGIDLPDPSSFAMSGLSSTELSLGAALIVTRKRHHNKAR